MLNEIREDDRLQLFERGFVILQNFLPEDTVQRLTFEVVRLCAQEDTGDSTRRDIVFLTDVERRSDYIFDTARSPRLVDFICSLMDTRAVPMNVELFVKPPRSAFVTPIHQDHAFYKKPFERAALTIWIALDDATGESGALQYAEGRWSITLPHKRSQVDYFSLEIEGASELNFRLAEVQRGGCVVHHSFAVHRSGPNVTDAPRRALAFTYRAAS